MSVKNLLDYEKYLVFGAVRSGLAAARLLCARGKTVALYDEASPGKLLPARQAAQELGCPLLYQSDSPNPAEWDVMVLSPGVPTTHPLVLRAQESGCLVRSEIEVGFLACHAPVLAVTGTNGKTTVTHLVAHLMSALGRPAVMAGNVGRALCDAVGDPRLRDPEAVVVCEASSYQLETIEQFHPLVACVLNVTPDHLDRYPDMRSYALAKARITQAQEPSDAIVLNADCPYAPLFRERTRAAVWWFSVEGEVDRGLYLKDGSLWLSAGDGVAPRLLLRRGDIPLPGLHNVQNVLAGLAVVIAAGGDPLRAAAHVASFPAVPHRIEPVGELQGVRYYNDSKATNLDSLEKALESFEQPIVLIAGGRDKGAPWTRLNDLVARKVKALVLIGEAAPIGLAAWGSLVARVEDASDMADAVHRAREIAESGDVVLLSPGCASFDMYDNFEQRGDHFRSIVSAMIQGGASKP